MKYRGNEKYARSSERGCEEEEKESVDLFAIRQEEKQRNRRRIENKKRDLLKNELSHKKDKAPRRAKKEIRERD